MVDEPELPRGVAVSRRTEAAPWSADLSAPRPSIHVVVRGSFYLSRGAHHAISLAPGDVVLLAASSDPDTEGTRIHCVPRRAVDLARRAEHENAELISAEYAPTTQESLLGAAPMLHLTGADQHPALAAIVGLLRAALMTKTTAGGRLARSLLDPLLAYLLHDSAPLSDDAREPRDPRLLRVIDLMMSRPGERWTVGSLAKAAGMSRAAFARRFLAEVGVPPGERLSKIRMDIGVRRLLESDDSLGSIAAEIGYASEFAWSRAFKRAMGEAPGTFRRLHRAGGGALRTPPIRAAA